LTFEEFVAGHGQSLLRLAFVLSGDRQLAEDLTQTALADAYRHWRKVQAVRSPEAYVRRMLVNAHLSWRRRRWTTEQPTDLRDATGAVLADPGEAIAARDQMRVLLAGLASRARTVLVLRFYVDLDDAAIAERWVSVRVRCGRPLRVPWRACVGPPSSTHWGRPDEQLHRAAVA
jgi:RNA polymerase sigma factor (sigma-70 family)